MRYTARWAATLGLAATAACWPLAQAALAAPDSLYAPSALVLTFGHGENAAYVNPARAVTLSCAPTSVGTHPVPAMACAELRAVNGDLGALESRGDVMCTKEYNPVVVTAEGVWEGRRVAYERTFPNECVKNAYGYSVFAF
ncbi:MULTISPECIES: subtilase-type protease inhibitor [unclassified Streptomyces]|uniref:subtilase-type protease inhibitor n=1 Tax=unclassified Streptomyces TaxID=2593676 RepID=UPI001F0424E2|nr:MULTISPECIES: subtilase-type protease inhibitor [unclassified Streptomyces]MCH0567391.1 subtilase-type protease inhibitor [Streptomyces sp. MUM 2J]MCH0571786.1 subtilase-type protease inhibitor [Streptomyces sp. MUM 136J]